MESTEGAIQTSLSPYKYTPLPTVRTCRLVRLKRKLHRATNTVQVELVEADIDHPPIYNALSYAWDSPTPDSFVVCHGSAIPITLNCQAALKRLRKCDSNQLLFVDAICINQDSTSERNHQVSAMGDIYANAQKVICWFGDYDHSLNDDMPRINHAIFCKVNSWGQWANPLRHYFWSKSYQDFLFESHFELKASTWSERVWTVQEFALGKEIYLQCGSHRYLHKEIYNILRHGGPYVNRAIPEVQNALHVHELARKITQQAPARQTLRNNLHDQGNKEIDPSMAMSIMIGNRSKLTSEPKDKIFSLFSVFQKAGLRVSEPDYECSLENISFEVVSAFLGKGCSLQFLDSSCTPEPWPSWIPDLSWPIYERQAPGSFKGFGGEKPDHEIRGRTLRVRRAARVEQVVLVSRDCPRVKLTRLIVALTEIRNIIAEPQSLRTAPMLIVEEIVECHLLYFSHIRNFLLDMADIWNDRQFQNIAMDNVFPPEKRPTNARVVPQSLLRHLSYSIKSGGRVYSFLDAAIKAIPNFLWAIMDGLLIPEDNASHYKPSWRTEPLEARLGAMSNWDILVFLDNCKPYLIDTPYDHLREAFMGSRGFATSSGFCGFADAAVQVGDLMVRMMGMSTLMIVRPSGHDTFRLISTVDVDYDFLLPEIEAMWKEQGQWITIS